MNLLEFPDLMSTVIIRHDLLYEIKYWSTEGLPGLASLFVLTVWNNYIVQLSVT